MSKAAYNDVDSGNNISSSKAMMMITIITTTDLKGLRPSHVSFRPINQF
jgi:hypothetical protein